MENQRTAGYIMAGVGFSLICINAVSYIFSRDMKSPAFGIIGLVSVVIGLKLARKTPG